MKKIIGAALMGLTALAAVVSVAVTSSAPVSAAPRNPVTPAVTNAARFCDRFPDISYDLMTQCTRVALTPERQSESTDFPDGRVMVRECISEAHAEDDGHQRTRAERHDFIRDCLRWAGFSG